MRTTETKPETGAQYVAHLGTGTLLDVRDGVVLISWDDLGDDDRDLLDEGGQPGVWDVGNRCGLPLRWALEGPAVRYVVNVRVWWDQVNGNPYVAGHVVNVVTGDVFSIPFQYGRGTSEIRKAAEAAAGVEFGTLPPGSVLLFGGVVSRKSDALDAIRGTL